MKSSRLLKYFEEYIKKIDMNDNYAKAKYFHSLKSMDLARNIALEFNIFTEEEIVVIELIALFHDIGNFSKNLGQEESIEEDINMRSIRILFDDGLIRKITDEKKYDTIIKLAIFCHDKDVLPNSIDDKMVCICNIIRDVHKLEELRMMIHYSYIDNRIDGYPSELVYNNFKLFKKINKKMVENNADNVLVLLSLIFNINYKYSYNLLINKEYINKIINSLVFEDKKVEKFFKQIEIVLNSYIKKKLDL